MILYLNYPSLNSTVSVRALTRPERVLICAAQNALYDKNKAIFECDQLNSPDPISFKEVCPLLFCLQFTVEYRYVRWFKVSFR